MSTAAAHTFPGPVPEVAEVFAFAREEIRSAAAELWPGARIELSDHIPGVTGYVHRLRVASRELYAKHSFLGMSLVSILRGTEADRAEVAALLRAVVARLHRIRPTALAPGRAVLTYGDLKPEHLVFPEGPGGRPVLIDPGLLRARASVDAAKLTSRTVLLLASARPADHAIEQVVERLGAFAEQRMRPMAPKAARSWLREVLIVWLMDTVNILTTFLSAPAALPLPPRGRSLVQRAVAVCTMADRISTALGSGLDTPRVWDIALARAKAVAG